jgi:hypothetical protein
VFRRFGTRAGIFQALLDDDERDFQERLTSRRLLRSTALRVNRFA